MLGRFSVRGLVAGVVLALGVGLIAPYGQVAQAADGSNTDVGIEVSSQDVAGPLVTNVVQGRLGTVFVSVMPGMPDALVDDSGVFGCVDGVCVPETYRVWLRKVADSSGAAVSDSDWFDGYCVVPDPDPVTAPWRVCRVTQGATYLLSVQAVFSGSGGGPVYGVPSSAVRFVAKNGSADFGAVPVSGGAVDGIAPEGVVAGFAVVDSYEQWADVLGFPDRKALVDAVRGLNSAGLAAEGLHEGEDLPAVVARTVAGDLDDTGAPVSINWDRRGDRDLMYRSYPQGSVGDDTAWVDVESSGLDPCVESDYLGRHLGYTPQEVSEVASEGRRAALWAAAGLIFLMGQFALDRIAGLTSLNSSTRAAALLGSDSAMHVTQANLTRADSVTADMVRQSVKNIEALQGEIDTRVEFEDLKGPAYRDALANDPLFAVMMDRLRRDPDFVAATKQSTDLSAALKNVVDEVGRGDLTGFRAIASWVADNHATVASHVDQVKQEYQQYVDDDLESEAQKPFRGSVDEYKTMGGERRYAHTVMNGVPARARSMSPARLLTRSGSGLSVVTEPDSISEGDVDDGDEPVIPEGSTLAVNTSESPGWLTFLWRPRLIGQAPTHTYIEYRQVSRFTNLFGGERVWQRYDLYRGTEDEGVPFGSVAAATVPALMFNIHSDVEFRVRETYGNGVDASTNTVVVTDRHFPLGGNLISTPPPMDTRNLDDPWITIATFGLSRSWGEGVYKVTAYETDGYGSAHYVDPVMREIPVELVQVTRDRMFTVRARLSDIQSGYSSITGRGPALYQGTFMVVITFPKDPKHKPVIFRNQLSLGDLERRPEVFLRDDSVVQGFQVGPYSELLSSSFQSRSDGGISITALSTSPDVTEGRRFVVEVINPNTGLWNRVHVVDDPAGSLAHTRSNREVFSSSFAVPASALTQFYPSGDFRAASHLRVRVGMMTQGIRPPIDYNWQRDSATGRWVAVPPDSSDAGSSESDAGENDVPATFWMNSGIASEVLPIDGRSRVTRTTAFYEVWSQSDATQSGGTARTRGRPAYKDGFLRFLWYHTATPSVDAVAAVGDKYESVSVNGGTGKSISAGHFDNAEEIRMAASVSNVSLANRLLAEVFVGKHAYAVMAAWKLFDRAAVNSDALVGSLHGTAEERGSLDCRFADSSIVHEFGLSGDDTSVSDAIRFVAPGSANDAGLVVTGAGAVPVLGGAVKMLNVSSKLKSAYIPLKEGSLVSRAWFRVAGGTSSAGGGSSPGVWVMCADSVPVGEEEIAPSIYGYATCSGLDATKKFEFRVQQFNPVISDDSAQFGWGPYSTVIPEGEELLANPSDMPSKPVIVSVDAEEIDPAASVVGVKNRRAVISTLSGGGSGGSTDLVTRLVDDSSAMPSSKLYSNVHVAGIRVSWKGGVGPFRVVARDSSGYTLNGCGAAGLPSGASTWSRSVLCQGLIPGFAYTFKVIDVGAEDVTPYLGSHATGWTKPLCVSSHVDNCYQGRYLKSSPPSSSALSLLSATVLGSAALGVPVEVVPSDSVVDALMSGYRAICVGEDGVAWSAESSQRTIFVETPPGEYACKAAAYREYDGTVGPWMEVSGKAAVGVAPDIPVGVVLAPLSGGFTASWVAPLKLGGGKGEGPGLASRFEIRYRKDASSPGSVWSEARTATTSTSVSGLAGAMGYEVQVRAVNAIGASPWSNSVRVTTGPTVPDAPLNISADVSSSAGSLAVRWNTPDHDGGSPITGYRVMCVAPEVQTTAWSEAQEVPFWWWIMPSIAPYLVKEKMAFAVEVPALARSAVISGVDTSRFNYSCSVAAKNGLGASRGSDPVEVLLPGVGPVSFRVSRLTGALFGNLVSFKWDHVKGAEDYRLYFRKAGSLTWREEPTAIAGDKWPGSNNIVKSFGRGYEFMVTAVVGGRETRPSSTARL